MTLHGLAATTFGSLLVAGALAFTLAHGASDEETTPRHASATIAARVAQGVSEWLKEPVRRALEDARDPRQRK